MDRATVQNYRRYAADCLTLASKAANRKDRLRLVEMAATWHDLASRVERELDMADASAIALLRPLAFAKNRFA